MTFEKLVDNIVDKIFDDMLNRRGFNDLWYEIEDDLKKEIMEACFECYCENGLRDTGIKELEMDAQRVSDVYPRLLEEIRRRDPDSAVTLKEIRGCLVAVNSVAAKDGARLRDGDVVSLVPASAGG